MFEIVMPPPRPPSVPNEPPAPPEPSGTALILPPGSPSALLRGQSTKSPEAPTVGELETSSDPDAEIISTDADHRTTGRGPVNRSFWATTSVTIRHAGANSSRQSGEPRLVSTVPGPSTTGDGAGGPKQIFSSGAPAEPAQVAPGAGGPSITIAGSQLSPSPRHSPCSQRNVPGHSASA
jgi:hypothetical protein